MTTEIHPLLGVKRPTIITRPAERLAADARNTIEMDDHALWITGSARVGKTYGARLLMKSIKWRPYNMAMFEVSYTNPPRPTESYFANGLLLQQGQKVSTRSVSVEPLTRLANLFRESAARQEAGVIGLIINEANRFTVEDYEHLLSLDNMLEPHVRLFTFLINQSDANRFGPSGIDKRPPKHLFARYFISTHEYTGLLWDCPEDEREFQTQGDVALALHEYDEMQQWPHNSGVSYTRFFAPKAWEGGWRLGGQIDLIREQINQLRSEHGLGPATDWRMKTFEKFVYYVLVRFALDNPSFRELTPKQIREALRRSAYIELELNYDTVVSE